MSEHKHEIKVPVITRNGVNKTLTEMVFGKKSDNAGKKFFAPVIDISLIQDVSWAGLDNLNGIANKVLRGIFADLFVDNIDEKTGIFNHANWEIEAADFTAGVAKLSDLEEQLDILSAEQMELAENENFGAKEFVLDAHGEKIPDESGENDGTPWEGFKARFTAEAEELSRSIQKLNAKVRPLRIQKKTIEAKYAERAAKRKAKEEASKSKTAVPAATA